MGKGKYERWLEPDGLLLLEGWARDGLTDEQIARNCSITTSTLYEWKKRYSEISEALKKGKKVVDREVENALLKRALGYEYTEETIEVSPKGRTIKQTVKHVSPDPTSAIFWLKNRKPEVFRDKQQFQAEVAVNNAADLGEFTLEELRKLVNLDDEDKSESGGGAGAAGTCQTDAG